MDTTFASGHTNSLNTKLAKAGTTVAIIVLVILALLSIAVSWKLSCSEKDLSPCQLDFYMFWTTGRALQRGDTFDPYLPSEAKRLAEKHLDEALNSDVPRRRGAAAHVDQLDRIATPFLFSVFSLWVSEDYIHDLSIFFLVSGTCYLAALLFLMRLHSVPNLTKAMVLAFFFFPLAPASHDLQVGNVSGLQLAAFCIIIALARRKSSRTRDILLGGVMTALTLFKPNIAPVPILFALHLLRQGRKIEFIRACLGAGIAALVVNLVIVLSWPSPSAWSSWFDTIQLRFARHFDLDPSDGSPAVLLSNLVPWHARWDRIIGGIVLGLSSLTILRIPRQKTKTLLVRHQAFESHQDRLVLYLALAAGVVCSKPMWLHYNVLLVPAIFEIIFPVYASLGAHSLKTIVIKLTFAVLILGVYSISRQLGFNDPVIPSACSFALYALFILGAIMHRLHTLNLLPVAPRRKTPHPDSVCSLRKPHSSSYNLRPMVAKIGCLGRESTPRQPLICLVKG